MHHLGNTHSPLAADIVTELKIEVLQRIAPVSLGIKEANPIWLHERARPT